jgi:hypothetical protein
MRGQLNATNDPPVPTVWTPKQFWMICTREISCPAQEKKQDYTASYCDKACHYSPTRADKNSVELLGNW